MKNIEALTICFYAAQISMEPSSKQNIFQG